MRNSKAPAVRRALRNVPAGPARDWLARLLTHGERGSSSHHTPAAGAKGKRERMRG